MPQRTLALVVEYDGSGYRGFQRQTADRTIAGELERALTALVGHAVRVVAAGRTDTGVHATGQVVSFQTESAMPPAKLAVAASALLRQRGIAVLNAVERDLDFSARYHARSRTYRYRILNRAAPSPLARGRALWVRAPLDVVGMRAAAAALVGRHDFAAFAAGPAHPKGTVREIKRLETERRGHEVNIVVTADAFLRQMVRIIVGTLIEVGAGRRPAAGMAAVLKSKDRRRAGVTAPPYALYLEHVEFEPPL